MFDILSGLLSARAQQRVEEYNEAQRRRDKVLHDLPTPEEFRAVGFTGAAAEFPRDELALKMFAAFNGVTVEQLPTAMKFYPNRWCRDAWTRVAKVAMDHLEKR